MGRVWQAFLGGAALTACAACAAGEVDAPNQSERTARSGLPRGEQPAACPSEGAALQVLGSGGPLAEWVGEEGRAGTSYLLWIDGTPRLLIDAGAGSFLRFAEAGGKLATLDAILLTHLHADHAGDLAGVLNSGGFERNVFPARSSFCSACWARMAASLPIMAASSTGPKTSSGWNHARLPRVAAPPHPKGWMWPMIIR